MVLMCEIGSEGRKPLVEGYGLDELAASAGAPGRAGSIALGWGQLFRPTPLLRDTGHRG